MRASHALSVLSLALAFSLAHADISVDCLLRGACGSGRDALAHLEALHDIAGAQGGNRAAGSPGHELSGNYVAQKLLAAGYRVELRPFTFKSFKKLHARMEQSAPRRVVYQEGSDFQLMPYSGSGTVTARVTPVDLKLGAGNASTSGCEASDFAGFPAGNIALVQRGTCPFVDKVLHAQAAGASGVVIFNQGNSPDREGVFPGTLGETHPIRIPVVSTSYLMGLIFNHVGGPLLTLDAGAEVVTKTSFNVIAESRSGDPDNVVMLGAHLDSVAEGPGMNDNGSGSAAILEVALKMANLTPVNKVRFAWFSAEELGLIGSTKYVESLSEVEKRQIALYVNIDMVASPNHKLGVYDGDGSRFGQRGPRGSDTIEKAFHDFFAATRAGSVETELNGRSDYAAFSAAGIAVGGLFTGAEGVKTEEEAQLFGGQAGAAYDACYHKACDDLSNLNEEALDHNTNAIAYVALGFSNGTLAIRQDKANRSLRERDRVVFPKHLHCHGDMHHE